MTPTTDLMTPPPPLSLAGFLERENLRLRLGELKERRRVVAAAIDAALSRVPAKTPPSGDPARDLLAGGPSAMAEARANAASAAANLDDLRSERSLLARAVEMGEQELAELERRLSARCVEPMRGWHRALVKEMARLMVQLVQLARLEEAAVERLAEAGISASSLLPRGGPARPTFLGSLRSRPGERGAAAMWLLDLIEAGHLDGADPAIREFLNSEQDPSPKPPGQGAVAQARRKLARLVSKG